MADSNSINPTQIRVFKCPSCRQLADTTMTQCRHCGATIDPRAAEAALETKDKVNSASYAASLIRWEAGVIAISYLLQFVPIIGIIGSFGFLAFLLIMPVTIIVWWVKYSGLKTDDPDYSAARSSTLISLGLWFLLLIACLFIFPLLIRSLMR